MDLGAGSQFGHARHIWRATASNGTCGAVGATPYATINSITTLTYTDTGVVAGTTYCYTVTAFALTTESLPSNEVTCGPVPFLLTAPSALQPGTVK